MNRFPGSRPLVWALLLWSFFLAMLAAPALAEEFHDHDPGTPCAQALLIEHWYQAAGLTPFALPVLPGRAINRPVTHYALPALPATIRGSRDPPPEVD